MQATIVKPMSGNVVCIAPPPTKSFYQLSRASILYTKIFHNTVTITNTILGIFLEKTISKDEPTLAKIRK